METTKVTHSVKLTELVEEVRKRAQGRRVFPVAVEVLKEAGINDPVKRWSLGVEIQTIIADERHRQVLQRYEGRDD